MQHMVTGVYTICPRSSDPFHVVSYHIKWVGNYFLDTQKLRNAIMFFIVKFFELMFIEP